MRFITVTTFVALGATLLAGCSGTNATRVVSVDAGANVAVFAYVDRDGDTLVSTNDAPLKGVHIRITYPDLQDSVASGTTNATGVMFLTGVPVGRYRARVDSSSVPDSLTLLAVDSAQFTLGVGDTARVVVRTGYPALSTTQIRAAAPGSRAFVEGIALNAWNVFGDSSVAVADSAGAIRIVKLPPSQVAGGDSVRILGSVTTRDGEPALLGIAAYFLKSVAAPAPVVITTAQAADAKGGSLDAGLVQVKNAVVQDTSTSLEGDVTITVDDGSGPADVVLDHSAPIRVVYQSPLIGQKMDVTGLLIPDGTGHWVLKPRTTSDIHFQGPPPA